jgi:hypothetical protein
MFKKGDKLIYIVDDKSGYKKGEIYEICDIQSFKGEDYNSPEGIYYKVFYDTKLHTYFWFYDINMSDYFITLAEWREQQIKTIIDDDINMY